MRNQTVDRLVDRCLKGFWTGASQSEEADGNRAAMVLDAMRNTGDTLQVWDKKLRGEPTLTRFAP